MSAKKFTLFFVSLTLVLIAMIGVFNRLIDPFWVYRDTNLPNFNEYKPKFGKFERSAKPIILKKLQPDALIFGSSISEIGFNPSNNAFNKNGQLLGYNFSFAESDWSRVFCQFQYANQHTSVKRALIGIHLEDSPIVDCKNINKIYLNEASIQELLFSATALNASIQTVFSQKNKENSHSHDGMYFYARNKPGTIKRFHEGLLKVSKNPKCSNPDKSVLSTKLDLSGLESIIEIAIKNKIDLNIFIYPEHAYILEAQLKCQLLEIEFNKLRQVQNVILRVNSKNISAWHFYKYHKTTAEKIEDIMVYWQDSFHINHELGSLMLEDIYLLSNPNLGTMLNSNSHKNLYLEFLRSRDLFLKLNPQFETEFSNAWMLHYQ